jgi:NADPH:quinone reductase-like Zn-dependent oxidoreductase
MRASPINPSDLLVVRGRYGSLPALPATPGFEGVGIVDQAGPGLLGRFLVGQRVAVLNQNGGNWADYAVVPATRARPVPNDLPDEQVASFFVNPATALALLRHVLQVPRGDWLLQSAAHSTLGKMIIRLARHDGVRTINVVRRREQLEPLRARGADAVLTTEDGPIEDQVRQLVGDEGVRFALDPVGGAIGTGIFRSLGQGGRLVVYGSLSEEPIQLEPRRLIAREQVVEGFWLGRWMRERSLPQALAVFRDVGRLIRAGVLATETGPRFGLDQIAEAVQAADAARSGKVLLTITTPAP